MAVSQNHQSRSRRDMRRSHDALSATALSLDKDSNQVHICHNVTKDGYYRGQKFDLKAAKQPNSKK